MADINGNPDTQEMYDHWNLEKGTAVRMMNEAHDLAEYGADFKATVKAARVAAFAVVHPDCDICARFAGDLPAPRE
jgi:hypothetical protein